MATLHAALAARSALVKALDGDAEAALAAMPLPPLTPAQAAAVVALASGPPPPLAPFAVCRVPETGALRPVFDGLTAAELLALGSAVDYMQLPVEWAAWCAQEAAARDAAANGGVDSRGPLRPLLAVAARATEAVLRREHDGATAVTEEEVAAGWGGGSEAATVARVCAGCAPPAGNWPHKGRVAWCRLAARFGNLRALQWARDARRPWDASTCEAAASGGHLAVLQWLVAAGCPWDSRTCRAAACGDWIQLVQDAGGEWSWTPSTDAVGDRHLATLQWAVAAGCPVDDDVMDAAARGGNIEMVACARRAGCRWRTWTCAAAAAAGRLELLQWLRREGCPWNDLTCISAVAHGHVHVLQWALDAGCPCSLRQARAVAARSRHSNSGKVVAWLDARAVAEAASRHDARAATEV